MLKTFANRKKDGFYFVYCILHLVITVLIDSTIAIPRPYLTSLQLALGDFHIKQNNDLLVLARPTWLIAFVWLELLLQIPFFLAAPIYLYQNNQKIYPFMLIYGVEAATTTFACLAEVTVLDLDLAPKANLFLCYLPMLVIPLAMAVDFTRRLIPSPKPKAS